MNNFFNRWVSKVTWNNVKTSFARIKGPAAVSVIVIWSFALFFIVYRFAILVITDGFSDLLHNLWTYLKLSLWAAHTFELDPLMTVVGLLLLITNIVRLKLRKHLLFTIGILTFIWLLYRGFNLFHVYYTGESIEKDTIIHIDLFFLKLLIDIRIIPLLLFSSLFAYATVRQLRRLDFSQYALMDRIIAIAIIAILCYPAMNFLKHERRKAYSLVLRDEFRNRHYAAYLSPEIFLYRSFFGKGGMFDGEKTISELPAETANKLDDLFGIKINPESSYPLYKEKVFSGPLPYKRIKGKAADPNVIFIMFESFPARLLGPYADEFKVATPNITDFAEKSMIVGPLYNSSIPTAMGIIANLCSYYPVSSWQNWTDHTGQFRLNVSCLPEILKKKGYKTYDALPGNAHSGERWKLMRNNGTDIVYGYYELRDYFGKGPSAFNDKYSDHDLMNFLLDRFDKETFKEPFLLTVSTYNFHMPYSLPNDFTDVPDFDSDLLKAIYAVDDAFGRFWTWFKTSKYYTNTIIVATSDHTMYPGSKYKKVVDGKSFGYFDAVPFIIYDPTHDLPKRLNVLSTSVDITPSLLHLIDINVPNSFEGLSVFDPNGRPSYQNILGTQYNHHFFMLKDIEYEFSTHGEACSKQETKTEKENNSVFNRCDFLTWFQYKKLLSANNRIMP